MGLPFKVHIAIRQHMVQVQVQVQTNNLIT